MSELYDAATALLSGVTPFHSALEVDSPDQDGDELYDWLAEAAAVVSPFIASRQRWATGLSPHPAESILRKLWAHEATYVHKHIEERGEAPAGVWLGQVEQQWTLSGLPQQIDLTPTEAEYLRSLTMPRHPQQEMHRPLPTG